MNLDLDSYLETHSSAEPDWLRTLNRRTNLRLLNGRMCSGPVQGRLLKMLVEMIRPSSAIELGTFSGYSALCIAEGMPDGAKLHTIEADDELEDFIRQSLADAPQEIAEKVTLHIGDALEVMRRFAPEQFDLAFMDADKRHYLEYYDTLFPLMRPGGYIIADNTLWDGHVIDPAYDRDAQTRGIRRFNDFVAHDTRVECVIIPLRDGLSIIRKL